MKTGPRAAIHRHAKSFGTDREPPPVRRFIKISMVLVMLGVGLGGAALFRRNGTRPANPSALPPNTLNLRASETATPGFDFAQSAPIPGPVELGRADPKPLEMLRIPVALRAGEMKADDRPPQLPPRYQGSFESVAVVPSGRRTDLAAPPPFRNSPIRKLPPTFERREDVERTHKIVDGDTLPLLARRYLGQHDRYLELYEANRHVLAAADILPIGVVLKIPSLESPPPATDPPAEPSPAKTIQTISAPAEGGRLVPVPPGLLRRRPK